MSATCSPQHCTHKATEMRRRPKSNGAWGVKRQCLACGQAVGGEVKHAQARHESRVLRLEQIPGWDEALTESGERLQAKSWAKRRAEHQIELAEKNAAWWAQYTAYLRTPQWRDKRRRVLERDGGTCQACLRRPATQVHHLTYAHVFNEPLFELTAICDVCHQALHEHMREDVA